jgi:hypothetical protein
MLLLNQDSKEWKARAQRAEACNHECLCQWEKERERRKKLEGMLQTRNLHGGWMPNA